MNETLDSTAGPFERPADATPIVKLAGRDGGLILIGLSLWAAAEAFYSVTGLAFAAILSTLDGLVVGVVVAGLAHEWGHFAGARLADGIAPTKPIGSFFPIFDFDMQHSDARAFRAMSVGGNVGHWMVVLLFALSLPGSSPGQIALVSGAFGFGIFASTTEFPIIRLAYAGKSPAECFKGLTREKLRRNQWTGAGAGVVLFLLTV